MGTGAIPSVRTTILSRFPPCPIFALLNPMYNLYFYFRSKKPACISLRDLEASRVGVEGLTGKTNPICCCVPSLDVGVTLFFHVGRTKLCSTFPFFRTVSKTKQNYKLLP